MDIRRHMAEIPEFDHFLTVDEMHAGLDKLAEAYPEITSLRRVGTSTLGEPIRMLSIGIGRTTRCSSAAPIRTSRSAAMLIHHLVRAALPRTPSCATPSTTPGTSFRRVDPDGTRLNEGWFAGPVHAAATTPATSTGPAGFEQVEWTFPDFLQEALFRQARCPRPDADAGHRRAEAGVDGVLHNAGFGGVYYYVSRPAEPLYERCTRSPPGRICRCNWGGGSALRAAVGPGDFSDDPESPPATTTSKQNGGDPAGRVWPAPRASNTPRPTAPSASSPRWPTSTIPASTTRRRPR